jgi:hypothetical protein
LHGFESRINHDLSDNCLAGMIRRQINLRSTNKMGAIVDGKSENPVRLRILGDNDVRYLLWIKFAATDVVERALLGNSSPGNREYPSTGVVAVPSVKRMESRWLSFRHHWATDSRIAAQGKFGILRSGLECGGKCQRSLLSA